MLTTLFLLLIGAIIWFVIIYNNLRGQSELVKGAKSNIMAATRKRVDLAKRIADVAASYATHEKLTQITVSESLSNIADSQSAEQKVSQVMGQVSALAVAYPDLKANTTYEQLMTQWHELENDIHTSRETYNAHVTSYNAYQGALPQVLFAKSVGFGAAPYYTTEIEDMDATPDFVTDDGVMLKETMGRLKDRTKSAAQKAKTAIEKAQENKTQQIKDHLPDKD